MCIPHDITDVAYKLFAVQPFNKTLFGKILFVKERKYVVFIYIMLNFCLEKYELYIFLSLLNLYFSYFEI